jgi:hypothetical protein
MTEYTLQWMIQEVEGQYRVETGTQTIDVPDDLSQMELQRHLADKLHGSIGGHAQMVSYERAHKLRLVRS